MHVLLLGGHGKVALHLTPLLLKRAWSVTSVIRNPTHESEILALGQGLKGTLNVLLSSLEDVKSPTDAQKIIDTVTPDYVVWSAGMAPLTHPALLFVCINAQHTHKPSKADKTSNHLNLYNPRCKSRTHKLTCKPRRGRQRRRSTHNRNRPRSRKALHNRILRLARRQQIPHGVIPRQSTQTAELDVRR